MKRNSALKKMEKIPEDIGDAGFVDEGVGEEERGMDDDGSREWSWGEDERERVKEKEKEKDSNSKRRITSTARITRKGTFGERFREKSAVLQDEEKLSLRGQSFTSHDFGRSHCDGDAREGVERTRYIDTGTSTCDRIFGEEYHLEGGLSAGEGIPAVVGTGLAEERGGVWGVLEMNDGCDDCVWEKGYLQNGDTGFDIETTDREKPTHPQRTTRSRISIDYLKSRRPIPRKMIPRDTTRNN